jgi:DNA-binding winged helix-turn-helix (wHTH) protein
MLDFFSPIRGSPAQVVSSELQPKPLSIRFSAYEVNFASRELFKHGTRIKIQKQPFEILCLLLERPGEVVSREELRSRLWPDNTFVEYEDSLNTAVRKLRAALSDSSGLPRYIETIPGQGFGSSLRLRLLHWHR